MIAASRRRPQTLRRTAWAPLLTMTLSATAPLSAQSPAAYRLSAVETLPGAAPSWDYITIDTTHNHLFIGRRALGVTAYDLATRKVLRQIARSEDANATALVPEFDRGYTTNEDGTTTIFSLSTLETIDRIKFGADADAAVYEPASHQVAFMMGDSKAITFLDARTAAVMGRVAMPSAKLDGAVVDGGSIFVAERDRNAIARVDAARHRLVGEWKVLGCQQPTGLAIDHERHRLFVGCRGAKPVLVVMDAVTGKVVDTHEIGRGNDGVVYDAVHHQVLTANGVDANLVVFDQQTPDRYVLAEATTTRPYARTIAFDPRTRTVYLVTAEGSVNPASKVNTAVAPFYPNRYFDDTFMLLTYTHR